MDIRKKGQYLAALAARQQDLLVQSNTLLASGREDEANLKKVARNIYEALQTLAEDAQTNDAYLAQLEEQETAWTQNRNSASMHNDYTRVAVEDCKLAVLAEARTLFQSIMREDRP